MYVDGGSRGNPGPSALGFVVYDGSTREIHREGRYLGITTNNCAEYRALIAALEYCRDHFPGGAVTVFSDSELVVRQINGSYRVRNPGLRPLHQEASLLLRSLNATVRHVGRSRNRVADGIVNQTLDGEPDLSRSGRNARAHDLTCRPADRPRKRKLPEGAVESPRGATSRGKSGLLKGRVLGNSQEE